MSRYRIADTFAGVAVGALFLTAVGHALDFGKWSNDPALWFTFSVQQLVLGLIAALVTRRRVQVGKPIFYLLAAAQLVEAGLMFNFLGPVYPAFLVLGSGILSGVAGILYPRNDPGVSTGSVAGRP